MRLAYMNIRKRAALLALNDPALCWNWPGAIRASGYGAVRANLDERGFRTWAAHRAIYTILVGAVVAGIELDHLCRNRKCVNPAHLEPVSSRENCLRGVSVHADNARKTHCKHGHEFTPENTMCVPTSCGVGRKCRVCYLAAKRRYNKKAWVREKEAHANSCTGNGPKSYQSMRARVS